MTPEQLAEIEARVAAVTPGIWAKVTDEDGYLMVMSETENICGFGDMEEVEQQDLDNARFIAWAKTDIPALIAEVRRLQESLDDAKGWNGYFASRKAKNEHL